MNTSRIDKTSVGDRIKIARRAMGLTQAELGKMLGVTYQMIIAYEKGVSLDIDKLNEISKVIDVPVSHLLGFTPSDQPFPDFSAKVTEVATILDSLHESYHDHYLFIFTSIKRKIEDQKFASVGKPLG